jgi:hypothetical protein
MRKKLDHHLSRPFDRLSKPILVIALAPFLAVGFSGQVANRIGGQESKLRFQHHYVDADLPRGGPDGKRFDIVSKIWGPQRDNALKGKGHADYLENLLRAPARANIAQTEPPIRTDKRAYSVTRASRFIPAKGNQASSVVPVVKAAIGASYTNRTGAAVYLPTCVTPSQPTLEKKVEGKWVVAFAWGERSCLGEPVRIEPGATYQDVFHVEASLTDNDSDSSRLRVKEIAGTYRLVRRFYKTDPRTWLSGGYGRDPYISQLLPLRDRISNEFKLTE